MAPDRFKSTIPVSMLDTVDRVVSSQFGQNPRQVTLPSNLSLYQMILQEWGYNVSTPLQVAQMEAEKRALQEQLRLSQEQLKQSNAQRDEYQQLSQTDVLTGLFNRRYLMGAIDKKVIALNQYAGVLEHKRHNDSDEHALSFAICDLDHFKKVNDTYGHQAGDQVLRQFASVIKSNLREYDVAARIGGEEFALLLPSTNIESAKGIVDRIREHVSETKFIDGHQVTVSIGLTQAVYGDDSDMIINRADTALYDAKETGRNRVLIMMPEGLGYQRETLEHKIDLVEASYR